MTLKMDRGRLAVLPIFTLMLLASLAGVYDDARALQPVSAIKVVALINRMLHACFYALLIFLYFVRSAARSTTDSFAAKSVAVAATFLPFAIPLLGGRSDNAVVLFLASLVTISGIALALSSLSALGRSFSIIPQARSLVRTGPYKLVRHPIYLGEMISILGIVLARPSAAAAAIYCVLAALLVYRAAEEERLLAGVFPEYETYLSGRARFIPGIF